MKKLLTLSFAILAFGLSAQNVDAGKVALKNVGGDGFNYTLTTTNQKEQAAATKSFYNKFGGKFSGSKNGSFTIENLNMPSVCVNPVKMVGECKEKGTGTYACGVIFLDGIRNITSQEDGYASAKAIMKTFVEKTNTAAKAHRVEEAKDKLDKGAKELEKLEKRIADLEKEIEDNKKSLEENKKLKAEQVEVVKELKADYQKIKGSN